MTARYHLPLRVAAVSAACAVVGVVAAAPAGAAGNGDVKVVNTETVQVYTSPTGQVQTRRVYEQLALTGHGEVDLSNPVSTDHLRNLDGFSGFTVEDGRQVTVATVSGEKRLRSVSDYDGELPLDVSVAYKLDGKNVEPGDVVGNSGHLEVTYTVRNVTAKPQQLTFDDGQGGTVTKTVSVPIPIVGSLTTTAPAGFTNVASDSANMGGDGKGGTQLSFTMTLFPPIGSDTAVFGYSADVTDAVIPRATVSALPVNPLASPTFRSAAGSYKGGADTGAELADGAGQIDENLLKLRDGASQLLAGLIQLRDGAGQLEVGLAGQAVPGAHQLADGAGQLDAGLGRLHSGARRLAAGAGEAYDGSLQLSAGAARLAQGTHKAAAGGHRLAMGARQLDGGLRQLNGSMPALSGGAAALADGQTKLASGLTDLYDGVAAMPASVRDQLKANPDYQQLAGALSSMIAATGTVTSLSNPLNGQPTLYGGLLQVDRGLRASGTTDCAVAQIGKTPTNCGAADAVQLLASSFQESLVPKPRPELLPPGTPDSVAAPTVSDLQMLLMAANGAYDAVTKLSAGCPVRDVTQKDPLKLPPLTAFDATLVGGACKTAASAAYGYGAPVGTLGFESGGVIAKSTAAAAALTGIYSGIDARMIPGLQALEHGVSNGDPSTCDRTTDDSNKLDDCGLTQALTIVAAAIPTLVDQLTAQISGQLLAGIGQPAVGCDPTASLRCAAAALAAGGGDLLDGVGQVSDGVGQLKAGGDQLATGAGDLSGGLGRLDKGSRQLAAGAGDLSAGLGKIHAGAGKLAKGATDAQDGSGKIAKGADDLATGLEDAANGSSRLKAGLAEAADGAPKLVDGAQRLSDEGTTKLVEAGKSTAQSYGEMYATMTAGAERAKTESMAFGAPEGAVGLTAYNYVIQGDDGEGGRNWARGVSGLAILAAGAGAFALRRRIV